MSKLISIIIMSLFSQILLAEEQVSTPANCLESSINASLLSAVLEESLKKSDQVKLEFVQMEYIKTKAGIYPKVLLKFKVVNSSGFTFYFERSLAGVNRKCLDSSTLPFPNVSWQMK